MSNTAQIAMFSDVEDILRHRIGDVLQKIEGVDSFVLWTLQDQESFGIDAAVSIETIQNIWDNTVSKKVPSDHRIKQAIKTLIEDFELPIGGCRIPGKNGYYFVVSDSDAEDASRPLRSEIFSMFRRLKVISPTSAFVRQLQGQITLLKEGNE